MWYNEGMEWGMREVEGDELDATRGVPGSELPCARAPAGEVPDWVSLAGGTVVLEPNR